MQINLPTPHGNKLRALLKNPKLPQSDYGNVVNALAIYENWLSNLANVQGSYSAIVEQQVNLLTQYKQYIELDLIFDSPNNFLYRQKGQLKLDNTIIEEFIPILITAVFANKLTGKNLTFGPTSCFSGIRFETSITQQVDGGGFILRSKDHDFAISRQLYIRTSHQQDFSDSVTKETHIALFAAECKTNLDKTMFQEASATALDVKLAVPGAKYYLLCEWLDMTPISTSITAIDEILILRHAKRMSSNTRRLFSSYEGRKANRNIFVKHLTSHPYSIKTFSRFINHISKLVEENSDNVLSRGYF